MPVDDEMKPASKLTPYQKKITATENVILCVAEAEKMVHAIGQSLLLDGDADHTADNNCSPHPEAAWQYDE